MFFITFYKDNKRYRISNGDKIEIDLEPNYYPKSKKYEMGLTLTSEVYRYLQCNMPLKKIRLFISMVIVSSILKISTHRLSK